MSGSKGISELLSALETARRSKTFCCSGSLSISDPGLQIKKVGAVKVPLRPKSVREISASGVQAPYGKGTKTIVDKSVRNTLEIDAKQIELSEKWNAAVENAVRNVAEELGLPVDRLQADLYKLLIYEKGGFFLPHRDNEKNKRMVGSLIMMLPSSFDGGELVVEHADERKKFAFTDARDAKVAEYVAFYADCQHEVRRVSRGVRVCLAYNLSIKVLRKSKATKDAAATTETRELAAAITHWVQSRPGEPMVFSLDHQYTASGLKPDLLKGGDRAVAKQLIAAAEQTDCRVHFGQVSRHLQQFADDGSFGRERYYHGGAVDTSDLTLGEVYEDEVTIDGWKDSKGKRVSLGDLQLDRSMLVSKVPLDQWKPTQEDYEGYNGNAGNTLDRWYHKSAIVIWSNQHHFDVLVRTGMKTAIETFLSMRDKLSKTSQRKLEQASHDCDSLARAIITKWPSRHPRYDGSVDDEQTWFRDFVIELPKLDEPDLTANFVSSVARRDSALKLDKFVLDACRRFGSDAMVPMLMELLTYTDPPHPRRASSPPELPERDADWLCKLACDSKRGGLSEKQLTLLCQTAAERFDTWLESANGYYGLTKQFRDTMSTLLKAAIAVEDDSSIQQLLSRMQQLEVFDLRAYQVTVCIRLTKWADKRFSKRPQQLSEWLESIRGVLTTATKRLPQPPKNFVRNGRMECDCNFCRQLSEFLEDASSETGCIRARKDQLQHVQHTIVSQNLDATSQLDRSTRPFTLILGKTIGSYERAVKQYHADVKLLGKLPARTRATNKNRGS